MRIDSATSLPADLMARIERLRPVFRRCPDSNALRLQPQVAQLLPLLDDYLSDLDVTGFHCTREPEDGYFVRHGLRKLDLKAHQNWFIAKFGGLFSDAQVSHLRSAWEAYFTSQDSTAREKRVWFCLSPELILDGCESFFRYFGGEGIHKAITDASVRAVLETIGRPVVVELSVPGRDISTFQGLGLGLLSAFHRNANPCAVFEGVEGYVIRSVAASEVVRVWEKDEFCASLDGCRVSVLSQVE